MCLSIPGKVLRIDEDEIIIEYPGEERKVNICLLDLKVGDYVIVSGGVVVSKISKERAIKFLEMLDGS